MTIVQDGASTAGVANVDANYNLQVRTPLVETMAGFAQLSSEVDSGSKTGTRLVRSIDSDIDHRMRIGMDAPLLQEWFVGAAINTAIWTSPVTTMTLTIASGFMNLNAGASLASAAVARASSYRSFPAFGTFPLIFDCLAQFSNGAAVASNVCEWGLGIATGTASPTDGVFFRLNATGEFRGVINFNGTEVQSGTLDFTTVGNNTAHFRIIITEDNALFYVNHVLLATVARPLSAAAITASSMLPVLLRNYNSSATSIAQIMKVSMVDVILGSAHNNKPWPHQMCGQSGMGYQGQTGSAMGSTASYVNSTTPAGAAGSNTAALVAGALGGQFQLNAPVAAVTDLITTSYQVPGGTAAIPGKSLYVTGIKISCVNNGAAVATSASTIAWSLAFGHTAVSLATAEAATTKAPRRIALGLMNWAIGAAIGASPDKGDLYMQFTSPILVQPGEFIQAVAKFINGTATASQTIFGHVTFDCYFE